VAAEPAMSIDVIRNLSIVIPESSHADPTNKATQRGRAQG